MLKSRRLVLLIMLVILLPLIATGCKDPEKLTQEGKYQEAYDLYMKQIKALEGKLGGQYSTQYLAQAKKDGASLAELYYKAAECKDKMGDSTGARTLYNKAAIEKRTVTEKYDVQEKVWIDAGYQQVWVPAGYKEIYIEGKYEDVWVDGGYTEVWVDAHYDSNNVYVPGHYEQVAQDGHYEKVWREGHYEQQYVDGHYENKWVEGHYEMKTHYETRDYTFTVDSPYVDMAKGRLGGNTASAPRAAPVAAQDRSAELNDAKSAMDAAYKRWTAAGAETSGAEYEAMQAAKKAYDELKGN